MFENVFAKSSQSGSVNKFNMQLHDGGCNELLTHKVYKYVGTNSSSSTFATQQEGLEFRSKPFCVEMHVLPMST